MKNFKFRKLICLLLVLVTAFAFTACDKTPSGGTGGDSTITDGDGNGGGSSGNETHAHKYVLVRSIKATCTEAGRAYYYSCECGKIFKKTGDDYVETTIDDLYVAPLGHTYTAETVGEAYLVSEATADNPRVYKKSCVRCGKISENADDTFTYGKNLTYYESVDKAKYTPSNLTVSLFDAENCVYGFTWNTLIEPARPVITLKNLNTNEETVVHASVSESDSQDYKNDSKITFYTCKATAALTPGAVYEYAVSDVYVGVALDIAEIKAVNPETTGAWKFVHVSDSQVEGSKSDGGVGTGAPFQKVLKSVVEQGDVDFIVHTGDVVEYSMYQSYWDAMIGGNFAYLSKIPVMAISGNHETNYKNGSNETFERFNYKLPEQDTKDGVYYSYSYGGVKFIMLNENVNGGTISSAQYKWLENELKNKTEKWTVVAMHNPMYSAGKWGPSGASFKNQVQGLFAEYGVDIVLQGHDHIVSATKPLDGTGKAVENAATVSEGGVEYYTDPDGVIYVMNGPSGNQSRNCVDTYEKDLFKYAISAKTCSWAEFSVDGDKITVTVKTAASGTASVITTWGIKKTA